MCKLCRIRFSLLMITLLTGNVFAETKHFVMYADGECATSGVSAVGVGQFTLSTLTGAVNYHVSISELSSFTIGNHIHGPANDCESAPSALGISILDNENELSGTYLLDNQQQSDMIDETHWFNTHTNDYIFGEVRGRIVLDCNYNQIHDTVDISEGTSTDVNADGIPDECMAMNRTLPLEPAKVITQSGLHAFRVTLSDLSGFPEFNGQTRWIGPPETIRENSSNPFTLQASLLQCEPAFLDPSRYNETIYVYGAEIIPNSLYQIQAVHQSCTDLNDPSCYSAPFILPTAKWGDVVAPYASLTVAQPGIRDILTLVDKWLGFHEPIKARTFVGEYDQVEQLRDTRTGDVLRVVDAWLGSSHPFTAYIQNAASSAVNGEAVNVEFIMRCNP